MAVSVLLFVYLVKKHRVITATIALNAWINVAIKGHVVWHVTLLALKAKIAILGAVWTGFVKMNARHRT